jgi:hypothetical protein
MDNSFAVAPLTKVSLSINENTKYTTPSAPSQSIHFEFVYGIAAEGFTAFEQTLSGKVPGDRFSIQIEPSQAQSYFEHLLPALQNAFNTEMPTHLNIEVICVSPVSDRELVRALALKNEGGGCGGGCECGCG